MSERRESEQRYSAFYTSLKNFLYKNSGLPVRGVARWGSRTTGNHRDRSDLDVIFWIQANPSKESVYPGLVDKLKLVLKVNADIGRSYNVINIWKPGISCDLVLLMEREYRDQIARRRYVE